MERRRRTKSRSRAPRDRYLSDLSGGSVGSEILKTVPRTAVIRRRESTEESLAIVEIENRQDLELLQDKSFIKSLLEDGRKEGGASLSSSSDEEQEEMRNPLFPTL